MALTVTSRPNPWQSGGNPVLYRFQVDTLVDRGNYRAIVEVFSIDDVSLATLTFSPNSLGEIVADIGSILRAQVTAVPSELLPSVITRDTNRTIKYYIKYSERWIGFTGAQTSDTANEFGVVMAANQIGQSGDMDANFFYLTSESKKFLTDFNTVRKIRGVYLSISMLILPELTPESAFWQWESESIVEFQSGEPANLE